LVQIPFKMADVQPLYFQSLPASSRRKCTYVYTLQLQRRLISAPRWVFLNFLWWYGICW